MEKRYDLQEMITTGWCNVDERNCTNLSKDDAKVRLQELINDGYSPNRLRAIPSMGKK